MIINDTDDDGLYANNKHNKLLVKENLRLKELLDKEREKNRLLLLRVTSYDDLKEKVISHKLILGDLNED